jgi:hypothetical protein
MKYLISFFVGRRKTKQQQTNKSKYLDFVLTKIKIEIPIMPKKYNLKSVARKR